MKKSVRHNNARGQRGSALLGAIIAIAVLSALMITWWIWQSKQEEIRDANNAGRGVAQFGLGLRGFIAAAQSNPSLASGTRVGVDWLKPPSCGGLATNPLVGYVPCHFVGGEYGREFSTRFIVDAATNAVQSRTSFVVRRPTSQNSSQVAIAARIAAAASGGEAYAEDNAFLTVLANVPEDAVGPGNLGTVTANQGRVLLLVDNAPSNDIWLRTDGTNQMRANLQMGGFSLDNARDGVFRGNVQVDGGMSAGNGLTVTGGSADLRGGLITTDAAFTDVGAYASQGIYSAVVLTGATNYNVVKPNCPGAASTPSIFTSLQSTGAAGPVGDAIYEARVDVSDQGTYWGVSPVLVGTRFSMTLNGLDLTFSKNTSTFNPADARIVVLKKCS